MKTFLILAAACVSCLTTTSRAAQTAEARAYCLSIRFSQGAGPFNLYSLDLTGISNGVNGELYPVFEAPRTHFSSLILNDDVFFEKIPGWMLLDVPEHDGNDDGFPDIFDVSQPFSGTSSGSYGFPGQSGGVSANWSRGADSHAGTCQINLQSLGTFTHTFNILEYRGTVTYTPGTSVVSGMVDLALSGVPEWVLQGPVTCTKSATDPHNELALEAGAWTNATEQTFPFFAGTLFRDLARPTNYFAFLEFDDWHMDTAERDYYLWVLSIDDLNDANQNGIPDFSDDSQDVPARRPVLSLTHTATELLLTINGDAGQVCEIQEASSITATEWPTVLSVTLTSDPQVVSLSLPQSGSSYWRVRVQ